MANKSSRAEISEQKQKAIDWLVKLRSDEMEDDELIEFADWLAQDHAHSEAFSEAEILFDQMALAAKPEVHIQSVPQRTTRQNTPNKNRKQTKFFYWMTPALAVAALALLVINLFLPQQIRLLDNWNSDFYTKTGEVREIQLSDGSRLMLNTNSAVSVDYTDSNRAIVLHYGQVSFNVAKDKERPFVVDTDSLKIKALGTIFQVYKDENDSVKVIVQEHAVDVSETLNDGLGTTLKVKTGQQLRYLSGHSLLKPETVALVQATAWQQKKLIINDQPLGDLITELQRYRNGRVFFADDELKKLRITGVFSLENPDTVLKSICQVLNLEETRLAKWWSVVHRK